MNTLNRAGLMKRKDVWTDLPNNLIEVPPVSLQSFMLKYKNKYREGDREKERGIKESNSKGKV